MSCMSKLIDADKLKDDIKCLKFILKEDEWDEDDEMAMLATIDSQHEAMITCCKCHGKGSNNALNLVSEDGDMMVKPEPSTCELCKGTGKISLQFYEDLQRGCKR